MLLWKCEIDDRMASNPSPTPQHLDTLGLEETVTSTSLLRLEQVPLAQLSMPLAQLIVSPPLVRFTETWPHKLTLSGLGA